MSTRRQESGTVDLGLDREVPLIVRSRLATGNDDVADVKTLMSKVDRVVDLGIPRSDVVAMTETELLARRARRDGNPAVGLLLLYPISKVSPAKPAEKAQRVGLDAVDDVLGAAFVFPPGSNVGVDYMAADLGRVVLDVDRLDEDEEAAAEEDDGVAPA